MNQNSEDKRCMTISNINVRFKRKIGEGGFAYIYLVENIQSGQEMVLKYMNLHDQSQVPVFEKEVEVMTTMQHKNLLSAIAADRGLDGNGRILMEHCPGGHLLQRLLSMGHARFREERVLDIFGQIASGVRHLHAQNPPIAHWDLKLENVLISGSDELKLCDFGSTMAGPVSLETALQRAEVEEIIARTTTQCYRAPEMVDLYMARELDEKVDVWALGCILYTLMFFKHPFQNENNLAIINGRYRIPDRHEFSQDLVTMLHRILVTDVKTRPTSKEVCDWIQLLKEGRPLPQVEKVIKIEDGSRHRTSSYSAKEKDKKCRSKTPKALNPNSAAARRLMQRRGDDNVQVAATPASATDTPLSVQPASKPQSQIVDTTQQADLLNMPPPQERRPAYSRSISEPPQASLLDLNFQEPHTQPQIAQGNRKPANPHTPAFNSTPTKCNPNPVQQPFLANPFDVAQGGLRTAPASQHNSSSGLDPTALNDGIAKMTLNVPTAANAGQQQLFINSSLNAQGRMALTQQQTTQPTSSAMSPTHLRKAFAEKKSISLGGEALLNRNSAEVAAGAFPPVPQRRAAHVPVVVPSQEPTVGGTTTAAMQGLINDQQGGQNISAMHQFVLLSAARPQLRTTHLGGTSSLHINTGGNSMAFMQQSRPHLSVPSTPSGQVGLGPSPHSLPSSPHPQQPQTFSNAQFSHHSQNFPNANYSQQSQNFFNIQNSEQSVPNPQYLQTNQNDLNVTYPLQPQNLVSAQQQPQNIPSNPFVQQQQQQQHQHQHQLQSQTSQTLSNNVLIAQQQQQYQQQEYSQRYQGQFQR